MKTAWHMSGWVAIATVMATATAAASISIDGSVTRAVMMAVVAFSIIGMFESMVNKTRSYPVYMAIVWFNNARFVSEVAGAGPVWSVVIGAVALLLAAWFGVMYLYASRSHTEGDGGDHQCSESPDSWPQSGAHSVMGSAGCRWTRRTQSEREHPAHH
jgi:hypothetical protein